jgi:subtilase family serine protease
LDIAIIDSLYALPSDDPRKSQIKSRHDFSHQGHQQQNEWYHGYLIFDILYTLAPEAQFHLYRVKTAQRTRRAREGKSTSANNVAGNNIIKQAIGQSIDDDVDVVNLSLGRLHTFCRRCVFDRPVEALHRNNTTIVAAIGNEHANREHEHVLCPALTEEAISVGGVTNTCQGSVEQNRKDRRIWVDTEDLRSIPYDKQGPYCSFEGCEIGSNDCGNNRTEVPYEHNIQSYLGNPEILAPAQKPDFANKAKGQAAFAMGTSFAAPIVAGVVARLRSMKGLPTESDQIRDAILSGGDTLYTEHTTYNRLNAADALEILSQSEKE